MMYRTTGEALLVHCVALPPGLRAEAALSGPRSL